VPEDSKKIESLSQYYLLGRGGLRVSPLCLGTMTFGTEWGWGSPAETARRIFDRYLEAGGNFIDTADGYTNGKSEELVGQFLKDGGRRDRVVLATKFSFNAAPGDPNAGGNGRKNIYRALEGSLRRLQTDYVDLYWLHAWDGLTPVEEVISTLDDLVREGKIRYVGFSDTPAWYLARAQTLAEQRGYARIVATQLEYSLAERNIEREHIPAAAELGIALLPWSPLAGGLLSGKYKRTPDGSGTGDGRLEITKSQPNQAARRFNEHNWRVVEALGAVAKEIERSPAQVALNWVAKRPGVVSTIIGASKLDQLEDNLRCLEFDLPAPLRQRLDDVGAPPLVFPYTFFQPTGRMMLTGGVQVRAEPPWYRPAP
jgi:aryl-alcohol dehydrogenase-like predicted oxidoreductase